jgi:hypothetical protein
VVESGLIRKEGTKVNQAPNPETTERIESPVERQKTLPFAYVLRALLESKTRGDAHGLSTENIQRSVFLKLLVPSMNKSTTHDEQELHTLIFIQSVLDRALHGKIWIALKPQARADADFFGSLT